ncbi:MAG: carboxypeptidase regulatory-like domain-containing protein [Planctomycetes bacterium]|nr:carboxypeptidase regulatory-like domain-containing protein [Planctomycetota bacterium]
MTPRSPLELPVDAELAALESRGQLLLAGRVIGFDGAPCPGAVLWWEGKPVATCDADGAYRVELPRPLFALGGARRRGRLYAVAAGVGAGVANYGDRSGPLDVPLLWRARLRGTAIDAVTRQPVGGASVEFLAIASSSDLPDWKLAATTDAAGRFEFVGLPPFRAALRASAPPLATPGWQRFDSAAPVASLPKVDGVAEGVALELELELQAAIELRGRFVPWPPPIDAAQAATARLEVLPAASQLATDVEQWSVPLAADGSFRCPIARTFDAALSLAVDGGVLWHRDRRIDGDETVIDLGRIELAEPAAIELHVDLPRELLELGATATLREISGWGGPWQAPIGSDGRVRFAPFDSRQLKIAVRLGERSSYFNSGDIDPLRPGEQRELRVGGLAPRAGGLLVAGRVVDADGQPGVGVALSLVVPIEGQPLVLTTTSDRLGVYSFPSRVWGKQAVLERGASIELLARGRCGFASVALDSTLPAQWSARRVDVRLAAGASLRGVVVDAAGAPLANGMLELSPVSGDRVEQVAGPIELDLDELGAFAIDSLELRDYAARIRGPSGWLELGIVRPGGAAVTLKAARSDRD